jgi:AcrR family transcriptional regulator
VSAVEHKVDGRTLRHQHRRPELLGAAVEYILEHGVCELSLRPMAKEIGVTHATLLRHFGTKEELVAEVVDHIRADVFAERVERAEVVVSLAQSLRTVWKRLCDPREQRQFALLFELVALETRDPGRFSNLTAILISDFLGPLEAAFRDHGLSPPQARDVATAYLALVRGLQLDLALTGDRRRVDAAMHRYIDDVTRSDARPPTRARVRGHTRR